jgi:hypothetical protein
MSRLDLAGLDDVALKVSRPTMAPQVPLVAVNAICRLPWRGGLCR